MARPSKPPPDHGVRNISLPLQPLFIIHSYELLKGVFIATPYNDIICTWGSPLVHTCTCCGWVGAHTHTQSRGHPDYWLCRAVPHHQERFNARTTTSTKPSIIFHRHIARALRFLFRASSVYCTQELVRRLMNN